MAKVSIKKEDYVMVIAGKDKGKTARVMAVDSKKQIAMIEGKGITPRKKAVKARKASDRSGVIDFPAVISVSNLMPICSACDKPTRIGHKIVDGKKERVCIKCGEILKTKKVEEKKTAAATVRKRSKKAVDAKAEEVKADKPEVKKEEVKSKPKVEATATKTTKKTEDKSTEKKPQAKKAEEKPVAKKAEQKPEAKKAEEKPTAKKTEKKPAAKKAEGSTTAKKPAPSANKTQTAKKTTAAKKGEDKSDKDKK
ncbi:MAG: 50S ribosomal protein L24 [Bacillota bacterium]